MTDFGSTVDRIIERTGLSRDEVLRRVRDKQEELYGFVTLEGAAGMVGKELGVKNDERS